MTAYLLRTRADSPELRRAAIAVEQSAWNALGYLNFTRAHFAHYDALLDRFADHQLCLVDPETNYPVAVGACVPFYCDSLDNLPAEGWDWVVEAASRTDRAPNMLGGLGISVAQPHRNKGLARRMIRAMRDLAEQHGYEGVVIPVRPTAKSSHPATSIEDYIAWQDERGRAFDPWLRSHLASGGRMLGACSRSMVVEEPVAFWEAWSNRQFPATGEYAIEGALAPVKIDLERQIGRYEEPNIWIAYPIEAGPKSAGADMARAPQLNDA
jgi:GNAT superfamily N-acetyltransferase